MSCNKLTNIIKKFPKTKVLVIGDIMLDRFIWGKVSRISPEAPVPVVEVTKETYMPGGAGNVVSNISSLDGCAYLIGCIGKDFYGKSFLDEMSYRNVDTSGIVTVDDRPTILKTRVIAHHQQVVRVDHETRTTIKTIFLSKLIDNIKKLLNEVSAVIISDYGKGIISPKVLSITIRYARKLNIPILVDPKIEHFRRYKRVKCITPNLNEALLGMNWLKADTHGDVVRLGKKIIKTLALDSLLITQGEKGMTLFENKTNNDVTHIPTMAKEVFDVTGAGDTVISALAMCLANKSNMKDAAYIANCAAGIVVGKLGTATTNIDEIIKLLNRK